MIRFTEFGVKGIPFYKDKTSFDLGYKGVSVIMGDNREGKISTSNAAGKSLLFSQLPEILVETPPQNDKAVTQGLRWVSFEKEDRAGNRVPYKIIRKTVKGKERYKILRDGKDLQVRLKTDARKRIQSILGWTEDDFYSLVYIDSNRANLLKAGSSAQRRTFVTDLFRLHDVDVIRKMLNAELRRVQEAKAAMTELEQTKQNLLKQFNGELPSTKQVAKKKDSLAGMKAEAKALEDELHLLRDLERALEWAEHSGKVIDKYQTIVEKYGKDYDGAKRTLKSIGEKVNKAIRESEAYDAYETELARYRKAVRNAPELPAVFGGDESKAVELAKLYFERKEKVRTLQKTMEHLSHKAANYLKLSEVAEKQSLEDDKLRLVGLEKLAASESGNGVCPTCGHRLAESLSPKQVQIRIEKLKARIAKNAKLLNQQESNREAKAARKELEPLKEEYSKECKRLAKAKAAYEYIEATSNLPSKPRKPDFKRPEKDIDELRAKYKRILGRLLFLEDNEPHLTLIERVLSVGSKADAKRSRIKDMRRRLSDLNNSVSVTEARLADLERGVQFTEELSTRYAELKKQVTEEDAFKLLIEAYGNKGIRRLMLKRLGAMLERQLNRFSKIVFIENFEFSVNIGTQFDILVTRKYANGKTVVSDVRKLSGAESRLFTVLMLLALLALLPRSRRTNLLILDEPTANMHPAVAENFAKFIKVLNKVIEHIVIITPLPDEQYHNARKFKAVKENGVSRLVRVS